MVSLKLHVIVKIDIVLFKYLQRSPLSNSNGPLSHHVPPSTIAAANKEVKPLLETTPHAERGKYYVYTEEEKFLVVKRAAEWGSLTLSKET